MVIAHLDFWKASLSADVLKTTQYQFLPAAWLSKKRYGRLQVTFKHARDAEFVWMRSIEHDLGKNKSLTLDWQYPENAAYKRERHQHLEAVEVVLKMVPASVSPELIRKMLIDVKLLKKGSSAFNSGFPGHGHRHGHGQGEGLGGPA
ncbi:unnamed protein product [Closterium sp. NIES-54]